MLAIRTVVLAVALVAPPVLAAPGSGALDELRTAYGGGRLDAVETFAYRLRIVDAQGGVVRDARYRLEPGSGRLYVEDLLDGSRSWWDGRAGWRLQPDGRWLSLGEAGAARLSGHVRTHFLRLWRDPGTRVEALGELRLRIRPATGEGFEVRLDPDTGLIVENRFDDGTVAVESDYRDIDGVMWPMRFEIRRPGQPPVRAEFSDARIDGAPSIPAPAPPAARDGRLEAPSPAGAVRLSPGRVSTPRNEYNLGGDAAQRVRVFARSDAGFANSRIWYSRREGDGWGAPREAPFSDARYRDSDPWLAPDGRTLYFVSDRPATGRDPGRKDLDLWRVALDAADGWGEPEHLGALNSVAYELGPELHDGVLYFNSAREGGPARMSLYHARLLDDGGFAAPEPLPAPFNDGEAQGDFTLSPDGRVALFWSIRDGRKDGDLFAVRRDGGHWSDVAVRLPAPFNSPGFDYTPAFSADGAALYFASDRAPAGMVETGAGAGGLSDLYVLPADTPDGPAGR